MKLAIWMAVPAAIILSTAHSGRVAPLTLSFSAPENEVPVPTPEVAANAIPPHEADERQAIDPALNRYWNCRIKNISIEPNSNALRVRYTVANRQVGFRIWAVTRFVNSRTRLPVHLGDRGPALENRVDFDVPAGRDPLNAIIDLPIGITGLPPATTAEVTLLDWQTGQPLCATARTFVTP